MSKISDNKILKTLDNSPRILFWDIDEFMSMLVPIALGCCLGSLTVLFSAPFFWFVFRKIKRSTQKGALIHLLYWHFPKSAFKRSGKLKKFPDSHKCDLIL